MAFNEHILDFNSLLQDIKSDSGSTAEFAKAVQKTQRRILKELEDDMGFYMEYAHMIAPPELQNKDDLHNLVQDTFLRAIHKEDALDETQDIRIWLMSEMVATLEETDLQEEQTFEDFGYENEKTPPELLHILRIHNALNDAKANLPPDEAIAVSDYLSDFFDTIPKKILNKLKKNSVLKDLHDNSDLDTPDPS